jgi:hypothetical protein
LDLVLGVCNAYINGSHLLTSDAGLEMQLVKKMGLFSACAPLSVDQHHVDQHHIAASATLEPYFSVWQQCRLHLLAV